MSDFTPKSVQTPEATNRPFAGMTGYAGMTGVICFVLPQAPSSRNLISGTQVCFNQPHA